MKHRAAKTPASSNFDLLIVGAGPVGCVIAERAASQKGWTSLLIDRRPHLAGNCFDQDHSSGIRVHQYGPHYFRTDDPKLLNYLDSFTKWIPGNYYVRSFVRGKLYSFPININTLEQFFGASLTDKTAKTLIQRLRIPFSHPKNSEEFVLSQVGRELYEAFYLNYTRKHWDRHPSDLAPSVCGRNPFRMNRDDRYVTQRYQVMPADGYTELFRRMIRHPKIQTRLGTSFSKVRNRVQPRIATVYCGPIDDYFDYCYGKLEWRSLEFSFHLKNQERVQPCVQINYPNDHDYTRSVEIKHVTGQRHPQSVITLEYPRAVGDPFYPVPSPANAARYAKYKRRAETEERRKSVFFCGRLAEYVYINTDEAIQRALNLFERLTARFPNE